VNLRSIVLILINTIITFITLPLICIFSFHILEQFYEIDYSSKKFSSMTTKNRSPEYFENFTDYNNFIVMEDKHETHISNGRTEYEVTMKISNAGSRINLYNEEKQSKHLILAGDSQTFGVGVNDHQVFSNLVSKELKESEVFNLGHMGFSPANTYLFFDPHIHKSSPLKKYLKNHQGVMIYFFFNYLSDRDVPRLESLSFASGNLTYYISKKNKLINQGKVKDSLSTAYLRLISFSDLSQFWTKNVRDIFIDESERFKRDKMFSFRVLGEMKKQYLKNFPQSSFYVAICRGNSAHMQDYAKKNGIKVLNFEESDFCQDQTDKYFFTEGHLNINGHKKMKEKILSFIQKNHPEMR